MGLNKQSGNMYGFVTHTWNPIKGRCLNDCIYCYMHPKWKHLEDKGYNTALRLDEQELKTNLGEDNFIFVGSGTDMWLGKTEWISKILTHIAKHPKNTYLFQTKMPINFEGWTFYDNQILGITLETNRITLPSISKTNNPDVRSMIFSQNPHKRKMVTIEPIIDFDLPVFLRMVKDVSPEWVNIGADSTGNKLPEPTKDKLLDLIVGLKKFTKVANKTNLIRLLK